MIFILVLFFYFLIIKIFKHRIFFKNSEYILLFPLMIYYLYTIFLAHIEPTFSDGDRYLAYAQNILKGFYIDINLEKEIACGPGYPFIVSLMLWLKVNIILIPLLNGLFLYLANVCLYKTLIIFIDRKFAMLVSVITILFAFYYIGIQLKILSTDPFAIFLLSLFQYIILNIVYQRKYTTLNLLKVSFVLAFLCLTKIIFSVIILPLLAVLVCFYLFKRNYAYFYFSKLLVWSMIICLPYLIYTYKLTGKIYYWGGSKDTLYWMSNPNYNEYGDWKGYRDAYSVNSLMKVDSMKLNQDPDKFYLQKAIKNIRSKPGKYFYNVNCNLQRLFFDFPYTNKLQEPNMTIFYTSFLIVLILISFLISILNIFKLPEEIVFIFMFLFIYLGGSSLVSCENRMLAVALPFFAIWISYIFKNYISISYIKMN
jgi:hypothetical protein